MVKDIPAGADAAGVNLPMPTNGLLVRTSAVAALAAYVGVAAALYQNETRIHAKGEALAEKHRAIESKLLGVSSYLDRLEKAGNPPPSLASRLREKQDEVTEERRESTREYDAWKEQSGAWTIKRWVVLTLATLAFLPVFVWGFQSWSLWARDRRLNRSQDE
jgi:hypothetical protein